jgi:catechol-2,3-dioxygenase
MVTVTLEHLAIFVNDINAMEVFYTQALGLKRTFSEGRMVFLSPDDTTTHQLVLVARPRSLENNAKGVLQHFAFRVKTFQDLQALYDHLKASNIKCSVSKPQFAQRIYFKDPEGNQLEVFYELPNALRSPQFKGTEPFPYELLI